VFIALLVWRCGLNYSLAVLGVPSLSPRLFWAFFFPSMPSGLSVTDACRGLGAGAHGLVVGWAGQLGVLAPWGCDCGCSPWAS